MRRMLLGSAAAAAMFCALGTTAWAADIVDEPAPTDWSGFYIGGHLGYGWANMSGCFECTDGDSLLDAEDLDLEGILGGLHAGYNVQMDSIVLGIEADVSFADMNDSEGVPDPDESEEQSGDVDILASVRARLGIALDDVLLYATAGIAIPDAEWAVSSSANSGDVGFDDIGGVAGGGVEFALTDSIRLRGEGLYYFFNDDESIEDLDGANTGESIEFEDVFVVRGGISLYFN